MLADYWLLTKEPGSSANEISGFDLHDAFIRISAGSVRDQNARTNT
jgi:hypothetical protein